MRNVELCTLCYLIRDNKYLMLHRVKKKNDINHDKWIGVGGHFESGESPEDCVRREVLEETGYTLISQRFRGIVTFVYSEKNDSDTLACNEITEYMHLFTSDDFTGQQIECDEGNLEWVDTDEVKNLPIWEGDKIFFRLLEEDRDFFSLKLIYEEDFLKSAVLDGEILF